MELKATRNKLQKHILLERLKILKELVTDKIKDKRATKLSKIAESVKNNVDNGGKIWKIKRKIKKKEQNPYQTGFILILHCMQYPHGVPNLRQNTLFFVKSFKTASCLRGGSILNALNLEKHWLRIQNCALLLNFLALFLLYRTHAPIF